MTFMLTMSTYTAEFYIICEKTKVSEEELAK